MVLLLASKACARSRLTARQCSLVVLPTRSPSTLLRLAWADSYSLVPAGFRTGNPPPAGRDEFLISVDSPATGGVTLTQVHGWKFHVDFGTPGNSTLGLGVNHTPNANVTVAGFVDAFTNSGTLLVPQNGTAQKLDTLGDKIMTPLVYQNRSGTESLWASQTVLLNYPNGPTAIRWYQLNVTGGNFPATPVQQQSWTNSNDGLWRWMPSIAVDQNGNMAIGYSTSSATQEPSIRYAGRFASDSLNNLGQGEAVMTVGGGHQTHSSGRWGDYSMTTVDPVDNITFWHTNEYYPVTSSANWFTRVGKFQFPAATLRQQRYLRRRLRLQPRPPRQPRRLQRQRQQLPQLRRLRLRRRQQLQGR